MESYLTSLKLVGMFPRVIEDDFEIRKGYSHRWIGKVSFKYLVFSVLSILVRIISSIAFLTMENFAPLAMETEFDLTGNSIWNAMYFLSELLTSVCVFLSNKRIKNCYNKINLLLPLLKNPSKAGKVTIWRISFQNPCIGIFLYCTAVFIFGLNHLSFVQKILYFCNAIPTFIFAIFCHITIQYIALLQSKIHLLDQTVLNELQRRDLSDTEHFLNILLYMNTVKRTCLHKSFQSKGYIQRNPVLAIHLRLQEVIDYLSKEFVDSVGLAILIQIVYCTVSFTLGSYFLIKSLSLPSLVPFGQSFILLYSLYLVFLFLSMESFLTKEVSFYL